MALLGRNAERLARVEQEALSAGAPKAAGIVCDLQDVAQINAAIAEIKADFGGIDILINNAGIWHKAGPLDTISPEMLEATVQTNLTGLMQMTQAALPTIRAADEGAILNVISKSGIVAQGGQSVYTATKYGARGFTEVLKRGRGCKRRACCWPLPKWHKHRNVRQSGRRGSKSHLYRAR